MQVLKSKSNNINNKLKEAALYVSEGENDSKIFHHPEPESWSRRAFIVLHHPAYYVVHLLLSVLLMLLAVIETPLSLKGIHPTHQTNPTILKVGYYILLYLL